MGVMANIRSGIGIAAQLGAVALLGAAMANAAAGASPSAVGAPVASHTYVVRPGDTLASVTQRVDPGGNPAALVGMLAAENQGGRLTPGERIQVP